MFDEELDFVSTQEEFVKNVMRHNPNDLVFNDGMSWGGFANTVMTTATAGGVGGAAFLGVGAIPGTIGGAISGAVGYGVRGLFESGYNAIWGDEQTGTRLANGNYNTFGNQYSTGDEYDAMLESYDGLVRNSEITVPVLGLHGGAGTGAYTTNGAGITIEPGIKSPTYNMYLDVTRAIDKKMKFGEYGDSYITFTGVNTPSSEYNLDELKANSEAFDVIYRDIKTLANKKDSELGRFQVGVSAFGGEDANNGAVTFFPSKKFMEKYKPDEKNNIWHESDLSKGKERYENALQNGITIVTSAKNLADVALYRNSYQTTEQIRIEKAGKTGVDYTDPTLPGYKLNYRMDPGDNQNMIVTQTYPQYMGNNQYELVNSVTRLSNQGTNIKYYRDKFFKETAYQIAARQEELRRTYK